MQFRWEVAGRGERPLKGRARVNYQCIAEQPARQLHAASLTHSSRLANLRISILKDGYNLHKWLGCVALRCEPCLVPPLPSPASLAGQNLLVERTRLLGHPSVMEEIREASAPFLAHLIAK